MEIERLNGFTGEVVLQIGDRQNRDLDGIEMLELRIPPGETKGWMPIYLPETMHINVQSQSQLYVQGHAAFVDANQQPRTMLFVSEKRNLLRTLPTVVKLVSLDSEVSARAGSEVACRLQLERTSNFTGPMELRLVDSPERPGWEADAVSIPADGRDATVRVRIPPGASLQPGMALKFRATGQLDARTVVISEAQVPLQPAE